MLLGNNADTLLTKALLIKLNIHMASFMGVLQLILQVFTINHYTLCSRHKIRIWQLKIQHIPLSLH